MRSDLFKKLGLNDSEVKALLYLYEYGRARATVVAKKVELPRTTIYSILEGLEAKGLVSTEKGNGPAFFVANHPSALLRIVDEEKQRLRQVEHAATELAEALEPYFRTKNINLPKLKFFEGSKNVNAMLYDNLPKWEQSMLACDGCLWGFQDHSFVPQYMPWLEHYWARNSLPTQKFSIRLYSNEADIEKTLKIPGREIRPFSKKFTFESSLWVCGDYVIYIYTKQPPHYSFQLKDAAFASGIRMIFQLLWTLKF